MFLSVAVQLTDSCTVLGVFPVVWFGSCVFFPRGESFACQVTSVFVRLRARGWKQTQGMLPNGCGRLVAWRIPCCGIWACVKIRESPRDIVVVLLVYL